jgi:hypothetical protein
MGWFEDIFGGGQKSAPKPRVPTAHQRTRELERPASPPSTGFGMSRSSGPASEPAQDDSYDDDLKIWGTPLSLPGTSRKAADERAENAANFWDSLFNPEGKLGEFLGPNYEPIGLGGQAEGLTTVEHHQAAKAASQPEVDAKNVRTAATERAYERNQWEAGLGAGTEDVEVISWDEYSALPAQQRAAIDANTLLYKAINADRSSGAVVNDETDKEYLSGVEALFGAQRGSRTYAPETLKTLQLLGISGNEGGVSDLDDYLNQSALLTRDDLNLIGGATPDESVRGQNALQFSQAALKGISSQLAQGNSLLSGIQAEDTRNTELNDLFELLSKRQNYDQFGDGAGDIFSAFLQDNPDIDETTMTRYFEDRLNAFDYGTAAGLTEGGVPDGYVSPAEFRSRYYTKG